MQPADFAEYFRARFPHLVGRRVLVALSGGADSVALLHLLRNPELALSLEAAHVHHGVRGAEADGDAAFCEDLCNRMTIPYHLLRIDSAAPLTSGREGTWRRLRYQVLLDLKKSRGLDAVATAHHRDDVAEGVLVQLLRGGGPRALSGIDEATDEGVIRPLLAWSRADISGWLNGRNLEWREDSSNRDPRHLRNRVRHELLPGLEEASPSLRRHLVHLAEALARDDRFLSQQLESVGSWIDPWEPAGGVPVSAVAGLSPALRWRWLHAQAGMVGLTRVTRRQAELFEAMVVRGESRAITLGGRWRIRRAGGRLWLEPPGKPPVYSIDLVDDVCFDLPLAGWSVRCGPAADPPPGLRWRFLVDRSSRLSMRSPREDDRVEVDGKIVRVTKLFARMLPRHLRSAWPVCCESDRIQWIPGVWRGPERSTPAGHVVEVMRCERPSCVV
jgi:tRNA(Ile)-lysidine synthetase-like protein